MIIGHLTNDEFEFINNSLSQNGGMSNLESESLNLRHPYAFPKEGGALSLIHI